MKRIINRIFFILKLHFYNCFPQIITVKHLIINSNSVNLNVLDWLNITQIKVIFRNDTNSKALYRKPAFLQEPKKDFTDCFLWADRSKPQLFKCCRKRKKLSIRGSSSENLQYFKYSSISTISGKTNPFSKLHRRKSSHTDPYRS